MIYIFFLSIAQFFHFNEAQEKGEASAAILFVEMETIAVEESQYFENVDFTFGT